MKNEILTHIDKGVVETLPRKTTRQQVVKKTQPLAENFPEILFITSYPPRECGIATYSQDLTKALNNKFQHSFSIKVCALESGKSNYVYPDEVKLILDTTDSGNYQELANEINHNPQLSLVLVQHEFGFFENSAGADFLQFLYAVTKPVMIVFHTVLPHPDEFLREKVRHIVAASTSVVVMTKNSGQVLVNDYGVPEEQITIVAHGTHLVQHLDKDFLKDKHELTGRKVLSTFGLLNSGKGIETTLNSLHEIIKINPEVIFLVIGKTHPGVIKSEGEKYRNRLEARVEELQLHHHVKFINRYLPLQDLLEYLQLTDIYLFTSEDPNQAVSGTFSYAMSCTCPIISTPIPHAMEVLREDTGIIIDFQNAQQLSDGVNRLMSDDPLRMAFSSNTLQQIAPTAWENSAIAYGLLFEKITRQNKDEKITLQYRYPTINLDHLQKMTTDFGIIQFSKINQPDIGSGYTLDDNARALIAVCMHYELTRDEGDLPYIHTYLNFIQYCIQPDGSLLNYVDKEHLFTAQNETTNLSDAHGRAIWALGYLISKRGVLPEEVFTAAEKVMQQVLPHVEGIHSTRAMAFVIKGLYYYNLGKKSPQIRATIQTLADRLVQMYRHESEEKWRWYESYLTYANSILPEALLCAWLETGSSVYRETAKTSFDFLLSLTFNANGIKVISNKSWLYKGQETEHLGEQPIDVAYTILALDKFYSVFKTEDYRKKIKTAFNWFLGNNRLHQIIYNPCTGGCYDGLEKTYVNLNQGAESTVSYLMARLTMEKYKDES